ncbi:MAG: DUF4124 domain-containing protein [Desulfobacterales bacterium]|nr:DUF4124 domain-containing protein [Desulfobacterales bacterium]
MKTIKEKIVKNSGQVITYLLLYILFLYFFNTQVLAEFYKWTDKNGNVRYSNVAPPSNSKYEEIEEKKSSQEPDNTQSKKEELRNSEVFKNLVLSLQKMNAKTSVGVMFDDYFVFLGEVKYLANNFFQSSYASISYTITSDVKNIIELYELAGDIWNKNRTNIGKDHKNKNIQLDSEDGRNLKTKCPSLETYYSDGTWYINIDSSVSYLFSEANKKIAGLVAY